MRQVTFRDIGKFINGYSFGPEEWSDRGYPIIRIQNLNDPSKPFNYCDPKKVSSKYIVNEGDLLISWSASLGVYKWNREPGLVNQHIFKVVLDESRVDKNFFSFVVQSALGELSRNTHGSTMKHITRDKFLDTKFLLPTMDQQKLIASKLQKAKDCILLKSQSLSDLDKYLRSLFIEMFGDPVTNPMNWPSKSIGEIVSKVESGWSPVCESRIANENEIGVLKLGAVTWCQYNDQESKAFLDRSKFDGSIEVKQGDLLFCRKNTYELVAASAYVFNTRPNLMMSDLIFRLNPTEDSQVNPIFLWKLLVNENQRALIQSLASGSAGSMPNISKERLKKVELICPPSDLQQKYAKVVTEIHSLKSKLNSSEIELQKLFNSIMAESFAAAE